MVAAALIVFWLVGAAAGLGIPAAISRAYFLPGGTVGVKVLTTTALLAAVAVTALVEITAPFWSQVFKDISYEGALRVAALAGIPLTVLTASQQVLRAQDRVGVYVLTAALASAGGQIAGLIGASVDDANGYMLGLFAGTTLAAAVSTRFTGIAPIRAAEPGYIRENVRLGLPTVPHSIAMYLLGAGDRVVVERLEGLTALATYTLAYTVGWLAVIVALALNNAWSPAIYGADESDRWRVLADTAAAILGVMSLIALGLGLAAPVALDLIAPSDYELAGLGAVSTLVAVSVVPYVLYLASSHVVFWVGATAVLAWATPLTAAVNVGLNFILIPPLGLTGAAVATLGCYVLLAGLVWWRATDLANVPWRWTSMATSIGLVTIGATITLLLPEDGIVAVGRSVAAAGLFATAGAIVLRHGLRTRSGTTTAAAI